MHSYKFLDQGQTNTDSAKFLTARYLVESLEDLLPELRLDRRTVVPYFQSENVVFFLKCYLDVSFAVLCGVAEKVADNLDELLFVHARYDMWFAKLLLDVDLIALEGNSERFEDGFHQVVDVGRHFVEDESFLLYDREIEHLPCQFGQPVEVLFHDIDA